MQIYTLNDRKVMLAGQVALPGSCVRCDTGSALQSSPESKTYENLEMSPHSVVPVSIGVIGATGLIGSTLIKQITAQAQALKDVLKARITIVGVTSR